MSVSGKTGVRSSESTYYTIIEPVNGVRVLYLFFFFSMTMIVTFD